MPPKKAAAPAVGAPSYLALLDPGVRQMIEEYYTTGEKAAGEVAFDRMIEAQNLIIEAYNVEMMRNRITGGNTPPAQLKALQDAAGGARKHSDKRYEMIVARGDLRAGALPKRIKKVKKYVSSGGKKKRAVKK